MAQVEIVNNIRLNAGLKDKDGDLGTSGQILSSTGDAVNWVDAPASGISGSGSAGQVAFWNGASSITGENDLWYDSTNDRLGIDNNSPSEKIEIGLNSSSGTQSKIRLNYWDGVENISQLWLNGQGSIDVSFNTTAEGNFSIRGYDNSSFTTYAFWSGASSTLGRLRLNQYGSGTFTGTATKMLAVTATGIVVEETLPTGGGSMNDWLIDVDLATGWPQTITDGEKVEILGGTGISTSGTLPSAGVNRVTINQSSYFDTKLLYSSWKISTTGTTYFDWTGGGDQSSLAYTNMLAIPADGVLKQVDVRTDVTQTGFTFALLRVGGSAIWTSSSTSLTADTTTTLTPNATISKSGHEVLHFRMVRATSASNNANIIITLTFEWDT